MKPISTLAVFAIAVVLGLSASARAGFELTLYQDNPGPPPPIATAPPASLGQQPFPEDKEPDLTPSQTNTNQLNQLLTFENTPDICAAGEGYISANFEFLKFTGGTKEYRYQIQGQYGFTDQIAAGMFIPGITSEIGSTSSGLGDITLYGQYKMDQFINPQVVDVSFQLDMVLPSGDRTELRDTGKFGIRPLALIYKDFGQHGPGILGAYGLFGFTITTNSDVRVALAATYQIDRLTGILEFYDQTGSHTGGPQVLITPGLSYRGLSPWEFTVGVPVGLNKGSPDWAVSCKVTYVFQN